MGHRIRLSSQLGVLLAMLVAACSTIAPSVAPSHWFTDYLAGAGQVFEPRDAPADVVSGQAVVAQLRALGFPPFAPGARTDPPIYGVVRCVELAKCRHHRGLVQPGETLAIWLVAYPGTSGANGGEAWATVDARTGQ